MASATITYSSHPDVVIQNITPTLQDIEDHADDSASTCSVNTNEAFLDMLGLSFPIASSWVEEDNGDEQKQHHSPPTICPIPLPRRCSRDFKPPEHCLGLFQDAFVPPTMCQELIDLGHEHGFRYITEASHKAPDGTSLVVQLANPNPHKLAVFENPIMLQRLWKQIQPSFKCPEMQSFCKIHGPPLGLNPRLRVLRYDAQDDDRFEPHFDATTVVAHQTSLLTVLLYLNDGNGVHFNGGDTLYLNHAATRQEQKALFCIKDNVQSSNNNNNKVTPKTGRLVLFEHDLFHASSPLVSGTKYVLRTDVLFRNIPNQIEPEQAFARTDPNTITQAQDTTATSRMTVSDLLEHFLLTNTAPHNHSVWDSLESMDLLEMTLESFLAPGTRLLEDMLVDDGISPEIASDLIQAASQRVHAL